MSVQRRPEPKPRRTKTTQSKAAPAQSHLQSKAVPVQNHVGQKPRRTKSRIVVPPLPLGSETSASPKDAQLKRLCEAPPPQNAQLKAARQKTPARRAVKAPPRKRHPTNAPTKTAPRNCSRKPRLTKPTLQNPPRIGAPHRSPRKKALQTVLRTENRGKIWRSAAKPLSSHIPNDACGRAIFPPQRPFIGKSNA